MPPRRKVRGASRVAASTRPRYARITAAAGALLVTAVSVLGGLGVLPVQQAAAQPSRPSADAPARATGDAGSTGGGSIALRDGTVSAGPHPRQDEAPAVPADSGSGRRVVFGIAAQRVWLVGRQAGRDVVLRTYLVSGSITDNLRPGAYEVYSKSMRAWGVDDSGSMRYMVRFAHGRHAAIGFHDIPQVHGAAVQTRDQLGTPQSHGCIRQWRPDAHALWNFAPLHTKVVVVA
jgi:hypothetical protein